MPRERRRRRGGGEEGAADHGGSAENPRRDRLALFGRAAAVPLGPCGSVPWEKSGGGMGSGQWHWHCTGRVSAARGAAGGCVAPPPRLASRSCFSDTHTAWLVRHHH